MLFPFLHSVVPLYADECKNEKYTYLFRSLTACRDFLDTLKNPAGVPAEFFCLIFYKSLQLVHEGVDVLELPVDRSESNVSDVIQLFQLLHCDLAQFDR